MIYLDHASTTPLDGQVLELMLPYLKQNYGNASSQHALGRTCANAVVSARDDIARILGCSAEEVFFTSGGSEAGNWALKGVCAAHGKGHLVVSAIEHPCISESAKDMQKLGFDVTYVNPDESGVVSAEAVEKAIRKDTFFCAVMHANNETGVIQPVEKIGEICRERGIFYYCDCVQTAGLLPLPVKHCTALGISAHKFYGPKGFGVLYLQKGANLSRFISGGMQEKGLRGGTTNTAAAVGCAAALKLARAGAEKNNEYISSLRDKFERRVLSEIDGTHVNGTAARLAPHSDISFDGCDGENILFLLDMQGVAVSTGSACSAGAVTPSHVLLSMGLGAARAKSAVRFTFGKDNTESEIDLAVNVLKNAVNKIRSAR